MAVHDLRMVSMWRTPVEPARSIVAAMQAHEGKDGPKAMPSRKVAAG
jgi:hypothetical protein